jgi:translation initiation factor IF-3
MRASSSLLQRRLSALLTQAGSVHRPSGTTCICAPRITTTRFHPIVFRHIIQARFISKASDQPLANEQLVAALLQKSKGVSAQQIKVRVLVDNHQESTKAKPELMSLTDAIQRSIDLGKDIIALSLDQEVPVLRVDHLNSFLFRQTKKAGSKTIKKQPEKEFRFSAGIEGNDFQRKVDKISETLEKGVTCIVLVQCKGWMLNKEPDIIRTTAKRVIDSLEGVAELMNDIKVVGEGKRANFRLRPAK